MLKDTKERSKQYLLQEENKQYLLQEIEKLKKQLKEKIKFTTKKTEIKELERRMQIELNDIINDNHIISLVEKEIIFFKNFCLGFKEKEIKLVNPGDMIIATYRYPKHFEMGILITNKIIDAASYIVNKSRNRPNGNENKTNGKYELHSLQSKKIRFGETIKVSMAFKFAEKTEKTVEEKKDEKDFVVEEDKMEYRVYCDLVKIEYQYPLSYGFKPEIMFQTIQIGVYEMQKRRLNSELTSFAFLKDPEEDIKLILIFDYKDNKEDSFCIYQ
jgi:hypothetical protein